MSYMALYRKWRPTDFDEVKGQDHIVTTLKNQIKYDRIGHAYLFCGTRGTGKTTVAKILAKAVNCENPVDGEPCGTCAMCTAIKEGSSMNVIEIDAASNNGVDNIRQIREEVAYSPTTGKYKVYIIDEVHMLSIGAFNALLKTLEEPPGYVIFILATTEANKIPITILSRCQRYDFRRISIDTIAGRLSSLMEAENITVEDKAIRYIAKAADGSMRDALSLLDQCIAFYLGKELTYDDVLEVLGAVDTKVFSEMLGHILANDTVGAINLLDEIVMQGRELAQFVLDFTWYLRNLLLVKSSEDASEAVGMSTDNYNQLVKEADLIEEPVIMRYIRILSELSNRLKFESQKRVLVEIALIKIMKPATEKDYESIVNRLKVIEKRLDDGDIKVNVVERSEPAKVAPATPKKPLPAISEDIEALIKNWGNILTSFPNNITKIKFEKARPTLEDDIVLLVYENEEDYLITEGESFSMDLELLADTAEKIIGKRLKFKSTLLEAGKTFEEVYHDLFKNVNMDIDVENSENDKEDLF